MRPSHLIKRSNRISQEIHSGLFRDIKPPTDLTGTNKSEKVVWQTEHQEAFDKVKHILTREPILKLYQKGKEHVLQTDACNEQIGATLSTERG